MDLLFFFKVTMATSRSNLPAEWGVHGCVMVAFTQGTMRAIDAHGEGTCEIHSKFPDGRHAN